MLQENEIARRLHEYMSERIKGIKVREVRIGVGYTAVALNRRGTGLAAVIRENMASHCGVVAKAGKLSGMPASELLLYLVNSCNAVERALGLATANAILSAEAPQEESDTLALMNLSSGDHVAMVGFFRPLVRRIEETGAKLTVLEKNKALPDILSFKSRGNVLKTCTVAIITATSILNNTLETILNDLENPQMGKYSWAFHPCLPGHIRRDACYPFGRVCCHGPEKSNANRFRGRGNSCLASLREICKFGIDIAMLQIMKIIQLFNENNEFAL